MMSLKVGLGFDVSFWQYRKQSSFSVSCYVGKNYQEGKEYDVIYKFSLLGRGRFWQC